MFFILNDSVASRDYNSVDVQESLDFSWNKSSGDVTTKLTYVVLFSLLVQVSEIGGSSVYGSGIAC